LTRINDEQTQKLARSARETALLHQQLTDLGRQVQTLLKENARLTDHDHILPDESEYEPMELAEDVNTVITNNLVLFKSIGALQEQNQKLLSICRELGQKMENEERDYREAMEKEQGEAIREAHEAMQELSQQLERQKKSSEVTIQAYIKERDALKTMLARVGSVTDTVTLTPVPPTTTAFVGTGDASFALVEVQKQFEAYKLEMGIDAEKLRQEVTDAQLEARQLSATLVKTQAKVEYLQGLFLDVMSNSILVLAKPFVRTCSYASGAICGERAGEQ
jgi:nucleoprotein TPR